MGLISVDEGSASRSATFREVFGVREFRALWFAEIQSVAGDMLARVALSILVFERTGSATLTAVTYALSLLPDLVAGPLLGGLADRYPRRRVMVTCDLVRAVLVGAMALMALPGVSLPLLIVLLVAVQLCAAPFMAAQFATLKAALTGERFAVAQATRQVTVQAGQLTGFAVGGVLVALLGLREALAVDAVTFALSALLIRAGVKLRPSTATSRSYLRQISEGARIIWRSPLLRTLVGLAWLAGFVVVPEGLAAVYASEIGAGSAAVGVLLAAHPAGLIVGALGVGRMMTPQWRQRLMAPLAVAAVVPLLAFAAKPNVPISFALLAISGACASYNIATSALFGQLVPDAVMGQAVGFAGSGLIAVQGLGVVGGGALAGSLGSAADAITVAGAVGLAASLAVAARWHVVSARQQSPGHVA